MWCVLFYFNLAVLRSRVRRFDGLGIVQFTASNHLFLILRKAAPSPRSRPRIHQRPRPSHHLPPHLRRSLWGSSKRCLLRISSSARWKRWTLTRPRYQRRRQPRGLASDRVAEGISGKDNAAGFCRVWSGRTTPRTTDAASIRAASRRRMEPALVSSSRCCFSHLSRVSFSLSLNALVSSVSEQRSLSPLSSLGRITVQRRWLTSGFTADWQWLYAEHRGLTVAIRRSPRVNSGYTPITEGYVAQWLYAEHRGLTVASGEHRGHEDGDAGAFDGDTPCQRRTTSGPRSRRRMGPAW